MNSVATHLAGGQSVSAGRWVFFRDFSPPQRLLLVPVHMCWNRMQLHPGHTRCGVFPLMKMETVLETRTKEDQGIPPLQKSLLDTTPHLQGSLPDLKSLLCWQSSVCCTPLITWPSPLWYAGKCLAPDAKGKHQLVAFANFYDVSTPIMADFKLPR